MEIEPGGEAASEETIKLKYYFRFLARPRGAIRTVRGAGATPLLSLSCPSVMTPINAVARKLALLLCAASAVAIAATGVRAAESSADRQLTAIVQKRLLIPDPKNIELGAPKPGPFPGVFTRKLTITNPASAASKAELEIFSNAAGDKAIIAQPLGVAVVDSAHPWLHLDVTKLHLDDHATLGPADAPVTIIEFADFECPYCARAFGEIETLVNTSHKGQVRLIWKNFPLNEHPWAEQAAVAAECARQQNPAAFWQFAGDLYRDQNEITPQNLRDHIDSYTRSLGLDGKALNACMLGKEAEARVQQDIKDAQEARINSTPTFIINGVPVVGLPSSNVFDYVISEQLRDRKVAAK